MGLNPIAAFLIVFVILLVALIKFRMAPPIGLFSAAILFGLLTGLDVSKLVGLLSSGFGSMMISIGLLIIFGGIIGEMLGSTGATEELAKGMVRLFGRKHDLLALNVVGFILSIPIYFGTAYIMTSPLVNALQRIGKKNMKSYVIAIFTGLILTHCCVAPTPGPLAVAGAIGAPIGWFILWGIIICLPCSLLVGWLFAEFVATMEEKKLRKEVAQELVSDDGLVAPDPTKPSAQLTFLLVLFPIVLIVVGSVVTLFISDGPLYNVVVFFGNSNIALFISMLVTGVALHRYFPEHTGVMDFITTASDKCGNILFIVGTGGSFSVVLQATTLSDDLVALMSSLHMPMLLLAFLLAMLIRAAVGSGTVACLTAVAVVGAATVGMGYSPLIAGMAICLGATAGTVPTDAVFWLPEKLNGLSTKDCLFTATLPSAAAALIGFGILMLLNLFSDVLPGMF